MNTETQIIHTYKMLGWTERINECDCCGRVELKGTYAILEVESGDILHYGRSCAASRMKWSTKEFKVRYNAEVKEQERLAKEEFKSSPEYIAYEAWDKADFMARNSLGFIDSEERHQQWKQLWDAKADKKAELRLKYPLAKQF